MLELLKQPWPWYTSGFAIAFIMVLLLYFGKSFGFSSNLGTICALARVGKSVKFFDFDWKAQKWNLLFLIGSLLGGIVSATILKNDAPLKLSPVTIKDLKNIGIHFDGQFNPAQIFSSQSLNFKNLIVLLLGGFLVGFGSRYAGGCTSGHAISGLSNLQRPSLIAVISFFVGGLIMTHFLLPMILSI